MFKIVIYSISIWVNTYKPGIIDILTSKPLSSTTERPTTAATPIMPNILSSVGVSESLLLLWPPPVQFIVFFFFVLVFQSAQI